MVSPMKLARPLQIFTGALALAAAVCLPATASRACQYCQMAADPEAYRFMTERPANGIFPLDSTTTSYTGSSTSSAPIQPVTDLDALRTSVTHPGNSIAAPTALAAPRRPLVPAPASSATNAAPSFRSLAAHAHVADLGLLALVGSLGWFAWRTRRPRTGDDTLTASALRPS